MDVVKIYIKKNNVYDETLTVALLHLDKVKVLIFVYVY